MPTDDTGIECLMYDSLRPSKSERDELFLLARGQGGGFFSMHALTQEHVSY